MGFYEVYPNYKDSGHGTGSQVVSSDREREMGEEKRHQMMQNLFGDQSEEEEEEEEIDSEHESNPQPTYITDEVGGEPELECDGGVVIEGEVDADGESDGELHDVEPDPGESEGERAQSSQEDIEAVGDQREASKEKDTESEEKEEYGQRVVTSRRRDVIESESEENHYEDNEDEEVDQVRRSSGEEEDQPHPVQSTAEIRDVFGDSDEEEEIEYAVQNDIVQDPSRSPMEEDEGSYGKGLLPEDMVNDEDDQYESEEEHMEAKVKERPVGPPLELEIPLRPPPAHSDKMNVIKVSNIMGIDPKPFDPKTYVEDDEYVTDESGSKKRIRLDNNIVRWRMVKKKDGTISRESNARFVRWSDGSLQLLIGNEVLDISEQGMQHDQAHLFLRHEKGILQSQGRLLKKMRFMPSSLTSNSHRLLTALVDSRHKKANKVKNCFTEIDPEREKEEKEKALSQTIRANALLNRKREKVTRKYTQTVDRGRQLSPGFLEDALDEDDEPDYHESRHSRRRFEADLEVEARAEKRIINAKKGHKDIPRKSSMPAVKPTHRRPIDFSGSEREESEYETDEDEYERSPPPSRNKRGKEPEPEYEDDEELDRDNTADAYAASSDDAEEPKQKGRASGSGIKRKEIESDEDSPPKKATATTSTHRRKAFVYDSDDEE